MKIRNSIKLHFPFTPWTCNHGWDEEKEGKPCPACQGYCFSCGDNHRPLDPETGFCPVCEDVFESDFEFHKEEL